MNTIRVDSANICINENVRLYDDGSVNHVEIEIGPGIQVEYCFVGNSCDPDTKKSRHITIASGSTYTGTGIVVGRGDIEIITEICGDSTTSTLDLLALATDDALISIEGVVRVAEPYRQVSTRVDQTNILIGKGGKVRGVPRLEIATDDIEGGHSCKIHRLGGDVVFYLTSRGLSEAHAEALLLNSEILKHLRTVDEGDRERVCYEVHQRLRKNSIFSAVNK